MITVIIPYYQQSPGILAKALASVAAQRHCPLPVHVIVVDDASPADVELASAGAMPCTVQVISRPNGGPAAARNTGLDSVPIETRYIAFLDSDDEWTPDHLARGVAALSNGYDFYFADHYQLGQTVSAFSRADRIHPDQHPALQNAPANLHAYTGDMLDQIIRGNLIGTSTVIYSFEHYPNQRFRPEFTNAGEDYLFWMELMHKGAKVAFSSEAEARYGKGINVYAGAGWGNERHLLRIHNELKYRKTTLSLFPLSATQQRHVQSAIRDLRTAFIRDLIHRISHRQKLPTDLLLRHFKLDLSTYLGAPLSLYKLVSEKVAERLRPAISWYTVRAKVEWLNISDWIKGRPVTSNCPVTVSLTSHGSRLATVHTSIQSIAAGKVRPGRMILWLNGDPSAHELSTPLKRLQKRGLEIRYRVGQLSTENAYPEQVPFTQDIALFHSNFQHDGNDAQISATYELADLETLAKPG